MRRWSRPAERAVSPGPGPFAPELELAHLPLGVGRGRALERRARQRERPRLRRLRLARLLVRVGRALGSSSYLLGEHRRLVLAREQAFELVLVDRLALD